MAASNAADSSESKKEDKEEMEDDEISFPSMGYKNSLAKLRSSGLFPIDDEDGVRSISNEVYVGRKISAPRNSVMIFKDCTFEGCTFEFRT